MKTISINAGKELLQRSVLPRLRPVADHEEGRLTARFLDLEVEYYIPLASGGLKSLNMVLPDDILDGTDITMETLHEWALTNLASFADRIGSVEEELRKADYPVMDDPDAPHMALLKLKNDMLDGAAVMMPVFIRRFGAGKGIWYAVFHSVSAFCNAGFDLMGESGKYGSLTHFAANPLINITIMTLIIVGGIGFLTWMDVAINGFHLKRFRLQSKVILTMTMTLILVPAIYFYFGEFTEGPAGERVLLSFFQSVTPRTAGFNTADLTKMSETGIFVLIILMLIGGSPASTAGGMKTTTAAVLLASAAAVFRQRKDAEIFGRRIPLDAIRSAGAILLLYTMLFALGGMVISRIEGLPLLDCLFETASAIGTVGLTMGITPGLSLVSRGILTFLMYFGRVGGLTLIFATVSEKGMNNGRLPEERITVG